MQIVHSTHGLYNVYPIFYRFFFSLKLFYVILIFFFFTSPLLTGCPGEKCKNVQYK